ncbi:hypothetical protein MPH_11836 [Macrophomina phaseolina MS6]|uniref:Uncharacterized protein n=1 Tax=Macrophomina phaseolina (strain MS6) TaxID=1126212 RepID=K2R9I7_MACPH|nr:hypothetical protein MPH_11836 [Macrophomina phaseolina MS6]
MMRGATTFGKECRAVIWAVMVFILMRLMVDVVVSHLTLIRANLCSHENCKGTRPSVCSCRSILANATTPGRLRQYHAMVVSRQLSEFFHRFDLIPLADTSCLQTSDPRTTKTGSLHHFHCQAHPHRSFAD